MMLHGSLMYFGGKTNTHIILLLKIKNQTNFRIRLHAYEAAYTCGEDNRMQSDPCQFVYDVMKATSMPSERSTLWRNLRRLMWDIALIKPLELLSKKLGNAERNAEPWQTLQKHLWHLGVFGPSLYASSILPTIRAGEHPVSGSRMNTQKRSEKSRMSFKVGDIVEIKSFAEIFKTLDKEGRHRGLSFTKEMIQFCGQRFKRV